jgi:peptidoglycan/LPS O-acetylase OafA/YrhL
MNSAEQSITISVNKKEEEFLPKSESPRLYGFDYLRVFAMVMVIANHHYIGNNFIEAKIRSISKSPNFFDLITFQVRPCAVSVFILISMFLFEKRKKTAIELKDRLIEFAYLYGFWVTAWILFSKYRPEPGFWGLLEFAIRGGGWLFYFIPNLAICTILGWFATRMGRPALWVSVIAGFGLVVASFAWLHDGYKWLYKSYYWLPTSFLMLPFLAMLLKPYINKICSDRKFRWTLALGFFAIAACCAFVEWQLAVPTSLIDPEGHWLPWHTRASMQFSAVAIVILGFGIRRPPGKLILLLGKNSLGIYCVHAFLLGGIIRYSNQILGPINPWLDIIVGYLANLVICTAASEFLRRAFKSRLV